jgi:hypothetical protein
MKPKQPITAQILINAAVAYMKAMPPRNPTSTAGDISAACLSAF